MPTSNAVQPGQSLYATRSGAALAGGTAAAGGAAGAGAAWTGSVAAAGAGSEPLPPHAVSAQHHARLHACTYRLLVTPTSFRSRLAGAGECVQGINRAFRSCFTAVKWPAR